MVLRQEQVAQGRHALLVAESWMQRTTCLSAFALRCSDGTPEQKRQCWGSVPLGLSPVPSRQLLPVRGADMVLSHAAEGAGLSGAGCLFLSANLQTGAPR